MVLLDITAKMDLVTKAFLDLVAVLLQKGSRARQNKEKENHLIFFHRFHTECIQWPHSPRSTNSFSHSYSANCKTLYICSTVFKTVKNTFRKEWWQIPCTSAENHIKIYRKIFCEFLQGDEIIIIPNTADCNCSWKPTDVFLVSLPDREKGKASEGFHLETWITADKLVGNEECQGEREEVWRTKTRKGVICPN